MVPPPSSLTHAAPLEFNIFVVANFCLTSPLTSHNETQPQADGKDVVLWSVASVSIRTTEFWHGSPEVLKNQGHHGLGLGCLKEAQNRMDSPPKDGEEAHPATEGLERGGTPKRGWRGKPKRWRGAGPIRRALLFETNGHHSNASLAHLDFMSAVAASSLEWCAPPDHSGATQHHQSAT